jgi:hypothetical protein
MSKVELKQKRKTKEKEDVPKEEWLLRADFGQYCFENAEVL